VQFVLNYLVFNLQIYISNWYLKMFFPPHLITLRNFWLLSIYCFLFIRNRYTVRNSFFLPFTLFSLTVLIISSHRKLIFGPAGRPSKVEPDAAGVGWGCFHYYFDNTDKSRIDIKKLLRVMPTEHCSMYSIMYRPMRAWYQSTKLCMS